MQRDPSGEARVHVVLPPEAPPRRLGPPGPGADEPPVAVGGGRPWIVSARSDGASSRVWAQRGGTGGWSMPLLAPPARTWNHHPAAAAAGDDGLWVVWVGEEDRATATALYASFLSDGRWAAVEFLPPAPGTPMAPAIAVDGRGRPAVVWAANDGTDAEIWLSVRQPAGWSEPLPLSDDSTPDITPSIAARGERLTVAWSGFTPSGYEILVREGSADGAFSPAARLGGGARPRAVSAAAASIVVWTGRYGATGTLESAVRGRDGWNRATAGLGISSPPSAAAGDGGRILLAWTTPAGAVEFREAEVRDGELRRIEAAAAPTGAGEPQFVPTPAAGLQTPPVPAAIAPQTAPVRAAIAAQVAPVPTAVGPHIAPLPNVYTAFGDSITNGVINTPDERLVTPGYRAPLQGLLVGLLGSASVPNAGRDGEITAEGVSRIDNAIRDTHADAIEILEGANDISNLIDNETIVFNLRRMVEKSFEEREDIFVFLGTVPPRNESAFESPLNTRIDDLNESLPGVAAEFGAVLVDIHAVLEGHDELFSDRLHPNSDGYQAMGKAWFDSIKPTILDLTNRGDLDASGRVDGLDLVRLALAFGASAGEPRYTEEADITGDGIVDGFDLAILAEFFGRQPGTEEGDGS